MLSFLFSQPSIKSQSPFWQLMVVVEATLGDAGKVRKVLDACRGLHAGERWFVDSAAALARVEGGAADGLAALAGTAVDDFTFPWRDELVAMRAGPAAPPPVPVAPPALAPVRSLGPSRRTSLAPSRSFLSSLSPVREEGKGKAQETAARPVGATFGSMDATSTAMSTVTSTTGSSSSASDASTNGAGHGGSAARPLAPPAATSFLLPDYIRSFNPAGPGAKAQASKPAPSSQEEGEEEGTVVLQKGGRGAAVTAKGGKPAITAPVAAPVVLAPALPARAAPAGRPAARVPLASLNDSSFDADDSADGPTVQLQPRAGARAVVLPSPAPAPPSRAALAPIEAVADDGAGEDGTPSARGATGTLFDSLSSSSEIVVVGGKPYLKLSCIGRGGSSRVYRVLGEDMATYALKRVRLSRMDAAAVEPYKNEIALLKRLSGGSSARHIIRLIAADVDWSGRCIHMVMEAGSADLAAVLTVERERTQAEATAAGLARPRLCVDENVLRVTWAQMLTGVQAIHDARVVHGDLKPANFVFVEGVLKLIDFGIAKALRDDTTNIMRDAQMGTLNYMSPEAIQDVSGGGGGGRGAPVLRLGRASDIWSLGCILFQMVYGRTPFADLPLIPKLHAICDTSAPIPFPPGQDIGNEDLEDLLWVCLQRDPSLRPPIAGPGGLLEHPFLKPRTVRPVPSGSVVLGPGALAGIVAAVAGGAGSSKEQAAAMGAAVAAALPPGPAVRSAETAAAAVRTGLATCAHPHPARPVGPTPAALAMVRAAAGKVLLPAGSPRSARMASAGSGIGRAVSAGPQRPNLASAIAAGAAALRHVPVVDKENVGPAGGKGGAQARANDGSLAGALRRGLDSRFARVAPTEDISVGPDATWS